MKIKYHTFPPLPKLKKSSRNALERFKVNTFVGLPCRSQKWDELISLGYVTPAIVTNNIGSDLGQVAHSITPKGLRLLADMLERERAGVGVWLDLTRNKKSA